MVRKIKPQRAQRDTERCYFPLSSPPRPPWLIFFESTQKKLKVSESSNIQVFTPPVLWNTSVTFFSPPMHQPAVSSIGNIDIP